MQEFCVKKKDRVEVISMIGVYGFLVTVVQVYPSLIHL
jgi:solute carrier family 35 protein F1/2